MKKQYSGKLSTSFWKQVNALPVEYKSELYSLGCVLQNAEQFVLDRLDSVQRELKLRKEEKRAKRAAKRKNSPEPVPVCCPVCGDKGHLYFFVADWKAASTEDKNNKGVINEHQCLKCGASFWT